MLKTLNDQVRKAKVKILVVDDEPAVREVLRDILEEEGVTAVLAASGDDGLRLFLREEFDAVFTDLGMPGMNGWEMIERIREVNDQMFIAVITGWGAEVSSARREAARVNIVLAKPFTCESVVKTVGLAVQHVQTGEMSKAQAHRKHFFAG